MKNASRLNNRQLVKKGNKYYLELSRDNGLVRIDKSNSNLSEFNWSLSVDGYPVSWVNGEVIKLHHLLLGKPEKGMVVDHINRNKLDNRLSNLRVTTQKQNVRNAGMYCTNTSGHKGVTYDKRTQKWVAQAFFGGRLRFGGRHQYKKDAVKARKQLEIQYN